ncbi:MAG: hypoxanthine phosphoribosyltransferase [Actinobacteria bacterium]|nr:hypoxanthine phosphoribosyltransferase [Actinomycetota bacterium]
MEFEDVDSDIESVVLTKEQIAEGIARIAREIENDYTDHRPLLIGVLKGAVMVMADLARELRIPVEIDWMAVSSYGASTKSSGVVRIVKDLEISLEGRQVIIVEDIVDSGLTLSWLLENFDSRQAASVRVAALLRKPEAMKVDVTIDYLGFDIPNDFVVGYGLDYSESYRSLSGVGVLKPSVYGGS